MGGKTWVILYLLNIFHINTKWLKSSLFLLIAAF